LMKHNSDNKGGNVAIELAMATDMLGLLASADRDTQATAGSVRSLGAVFKALGRLAALRP
jgi:hypothetical protein